jgi:hypothetical protein
MARDSEHGAGDRRKHGRKHDEELGIDQRGMVSQADMDGEAPNPERKNINPNQPVVPEKPI